MYDWALEHVLYWIALYCRCAEWWRSDGWRHRWVETISC